MGPLRPGFVLELLLGGFALGLLRSDLVVAAADTWRPNVVLAWGEPFGGPLWAGRNGDRAWVCRNFTCKAPVDTPDALRAALAEQS